MIPHVEIHTSPVKASVNRILAMVLRYSYLLRNSWPRIIELAYWPTVQMVLWGFISSFYSTHSSWVAQASGMLIAAVLLWEVLFRGQLGVSLAFYEEMYSRNLGQLFVSPLRPFELIAALLSISFLRTLLGVGIAAILATFMYAFSIIDIGLPLLAFFTNLLVFGWSIGLMICALVLRNGLGAESLAWAVIFAIAPISGIYYPVSVLPEWLQIFAALVPSSHVFEGMRAVMTGHGFDLVLFFNALGLNIIYLVIGIGIFLRTFQVARRRGLLLQIGE